MLPAAPPLPRAGGKRRFGLEGVMPRVLAAITGSSGHEPFAPVDRAVVVVVDGLGTQPLAARSGHARTLAPRVSKATTIHAGFPTTTASSLATLTTGSLPGRHGLVGYSVFDSANDRVVNQLSGWDDCLDPFTWQRMPTVFEGAVEAGVPAFVVAHGRYRNSGFTHAVLRGATFHAAASIEDRVTATRDILDANDRALVYLYIPELDQAGHAEGAASTAWTDALERADQAIGDATRSLRRREGLVVTADHGMLDIPEHAHVLFDQEPGLIDGVRWIAGEPRCLQLHIEPDLAAAERSALVTRWRDAESTRAWVATRDEAIEAGWFGPGVDDAVRPRIGDLIVAARTSIAYYDSRVTARSGRSMIGQHGSLSPAETSIPLIGFGAWDGLGH